MNLYRVRIVLHHGKSDYDVLHNAMESVGFERFVTSARQVRYHLPPGEYMVQARSDVTTDMVWDAANQAASRTHDEFAILVTRVLLGSSIRWSNLDPV